MAKKLFKDIVHGYIEVDDEFVRFIDTASFQRLRRLEQTSYRVLYPSASHDRFIHSLGVYHLGEKAIDAIRSDISTGEYENVKSTVDELIKPFLLACLLHDIGHAPFSHTCEVFYDRLNITNQLQCVLEALCKEHQCESISRDFCRDISRAITKNHELMSALVIAADDELGVLSFLDDNIEAFVFILRAITGCTYAPVGLQDDRRDSLDAKNALIRILNSSLIDLDKLDYTIRDSAISGYKNIEMDVPRLMSAFTLARIKDKDNHIWPVYKKSALSVIEHVFLARNNEIRWIQSHNSVVYETELLQRAVRDVASELKFDTSSLFCYDSLGISGLKIEALNKVFRLMADEDVLCLLKDYYNISSNTREYFSRSLRKKPIWKTHADFKACFNGSVDSVYGIFARFLEIKDGQQTELVTKDNFNSFFTEEEIASRVLVKYNDFFDEIEYPLDDQFELLLISYSTDKFSRQFDAGSIYLLYGQEPKSFKGIMNQSATPSTPQNDKGFFIYYKPRNQKKITTDNFRKAYEKIFNFNEANLPM
jgi:HD superfamily phosphohydrolase